MSEEKYILKDELFNLTTIEKLINGIKRVYDQFEDQACLDDIMIALPPLELKERISLIRKNLEIYLPDDYLETTQILLDSLKTVEETGDFVFAAYSEYIEFNGCDLEHLDYSLEMLGEYTKWFSVEFSIRKFINLYPEKSFDMMTKWSKSDHVDQRRLASEGLRPKLPWASKIDFDYTLPLKILDNLYYDSSRYVVRSVANHLNDVSKIDPDIVVEVLRKWQESGRQEEKEMTYLINHALRTSIKRGHRKSLSFIGYKENPNITISNFKIDKSEITIGDALTFSFDIEGQGDESLMIDYKVIYPMANNKTSEKVFKLKKTQLKKGIPIHLKKKHPFKVMTTKKLYGGDYKLILQINGKLYDELPFVIHIN